MYRYYPEMSFPSPQFNYFADSYENSATNYYLPQNVAAPPQYHVPQYVLPYAGVDLRYLPWSKVIEILEKQAESFKLFQMNAAYGYDWANEQNARLILEFNAQFRKEVELLTDEQSAEQLPVFMLPSWPSMEKAVHEPETIIKEAEQPPQVTTAPVEGSKKRKRATNAKKGVPKKLKTKEMMTELVDPAAFYRYSPAVSPISPSTEVINVEGNAFY